MRKLVSFSIGFAVASFIGAVFYGGWLLLFATLAFVLAGLLTVFTKDWRYCGILRMIMIGCAAGFLWFGIYDSAFVMLPRDADGETITVTMEATDYSYHTGYGSAVDAEVIFQGRTCRVKAYLNGKQAITPGDTFTGTFRFRLTTDGGMMDPTNHRTEGIFLLAYPVGQCTVEKADDLPMRHYPAVWRHQLLNRIRQVLPGECGAFAAALLLGERTGISYEMNTAFKVGGISHIIAVSGLHVSILFSLVYALLARRRVLSCLIGIPVLFLFAAIAGFTPSITRACIMQSLMLIAMVINREYDGPTALSFAALVMLLVNPLTILSVSFQLSMGCMMGIFLFSEKIREYLLQLGSRYIRKEYKFWRKLWQGIAASVSVSLSACVMTTPMIAYYFGCISIVGVLTNLLILWIVSFIFYGLIICLVLSILSMSVAQFLAGIVSIFIQFVLKTALLISSLPMAAAYTSNTYVIFWLIGTYVILAVFLMQKKKDPKLLLTGIAFAFLLTQLFSWLEPLQDDFRVTMLDVGQGQSILLQSDGKTFLVDCGGDDDEDAADVTAEALLNQGISRLDGIIVTHFDSDHVNGVVNLLSRIHADRLILPDLKDETGTAKQLADSTPGAIEYVRQNLRYCFGSTEIMLFAPESEESDNENSICILFQRKDCGILITGDRGVEGEMALLQSYPIPKVDILVAGHHGSAGSTTQELLNTVSPQYAFISVGEDNRYGHPADIILHRLKQAGCDIFRTDIHGTILFRR